MANSEEVNKPITQSIRVDSIAGVPFTIPLSAEVFVGRKEELSWIHNQLNACQTVVITAASGSRGVGTTTLAFEYARGFASEYPGGCYAISAQGEVDIRSAINRSDDQFGVDVALDERMSIDLHFRRLCTELISRERILIVLANADKHVLLLRSQLTCLPDRERVHVIVVSHFMPEEAPLMAVLKLESLPDSDGISLLEAYRPIEDEPQLEAARRIVRRLCGSTIAIESVAVYLKQRPEIPYTQCLASLISDVAFDDPANIEHPDRRLAHLLAPTLSSLSPPELTAIRYAAVLPNDYVPLPWIGALPADSEHVRKKDARFGRTSPWRERLRGLFDLRLLSTSSIDEIVRIHPLVAMAVRSAMESGKAKSLYKQVIEHVKSRIEVLSQDVWNESNRWELISLRHLSWQMRLDAFPEWKPGEGKIDSKRSKMSLDLPIIFMGLTAVEERVNASSSSQLSTEKDSMSTPMLKLMTAASKAQQTPVDATAQNAFETALNEFGVSRNRHLRDFDGNLKQTVERIERTAESDHVSLAMNYLMLATGVPTKNKANHHPRKRGSNFEQKGEALAHFLSAISHLEMITGVDNITLAGYHSRVANVGMMIGFDAESRPLLLHAISLRQSELGRVHPQTAVDYSNMAKIDQKVSDFESARISLQEEIFIEEQVYTSDHAKLAKSYTALAVVDHKLGHSEEARRLLARAIAILEPTTYEDENPDSANDGEVFGELLNLISAYSELAEIEKEHDNLAEAERLLLKARVICENTLGNGHGDTKKVIASLQSIRLLLRKRSGGGYGSNILRGQKKKGRRM